MSAAKSDGMTVEQAVERLQSIRSMTSRQTLKLVVPYDAGFPTVGAMPAKEVQQIHAGFDWDAGRVIIDVGPRLFAPGEHQAKLKEEYNRSMTALTQISFTAGRSELPAEQRMKIIKRVLSEFRQPQTAPTKA